MRVCFQFNRIFYPEGLPALIRDVPFLAISALHETKPGVKPRTCMKQGSNAESHVMQPQATTEEGPLGVMLHEGLAVHL